MHLHTYTHIHQTYITTYVSQLVAMTLDMAVNTFRGALIYTSREAHEKRRSTQERGIKERSTRLHLQCSNPRGSKYAISKDPAAKIH